MIVLYHTTLFWNVVYFSPLSNVYLNAIMRLSELSRPPYIAHRLSLPCRNSASHVKAHGRAFRFWGTLRGVWIPGYRLDSQHYLSVSFDNTPLQRKQ